MSDQAHPNLHPSAPSESSPALSPVPPASSSALSAIRLAPDLRLRVAYLSDLGRARDHQEDAVGVYAPADPAALARKGQLLLVADGMGGHQAGEVASQLAVAEIQRAYYADPNDDVAVSLTQAFDAANQTIYRQAASAAGERGMGTTAVAAVVRGRRVQVASVGDSRVYLLRNRTITQITEDHSWVAGQVRAGILTPEQAAKHPQRNLVTRAVGKGPAVKPDLFSGELQANDVLLLCSDGLTRHVTDQELLDIASASAPDVAVRRLVDLANQRGGSDNITVIAARAEMPAAAGAPPVAAQSASRSPRWFIPALIGTLAVVVVGAILLALLLTSEPSPEGGELVVTPAAAPAQALMTETPLSEMTETLAAPPTATLAPTGGPVATSQPPAALLPAPTGLRIVNASGGALQAADKVQFAWQWDGELPAGDAFEVRIWKKDGDPHLGAAAPERQRQGDLWTQTIDVRVAPAVQQGGEGTYQWTVAAVQTAPYQQVGAEASPERFFYDVPQPTTAAPPWNLFPSTPAPFRPWHR